MDEQEQRVDTSPLRGIYQVGSLDDVADNAEIKRRAIVLFLALYQEDGLEDEEK